MPSTSIVEQEPQNSVGRSSFAGRFLSLLKKGEEGFLCLLLTAMIILACLQIILRSVFSGGLMWADPLLRYMVLWSGLLGAALATSKGEHISLDLASLIIPEKYLIFVQLCCHIFSSIVAAILLWASILFLREEMLFSSGDLLGIPAWCWNVIFPFAFFLISSRYAIQSCIALSGCYRLFMQSGSKGVN